MRLTYSSYPNRQRGAALVTALVLLTIMTVLALTSMNTNTLEEKMAANAQDMNRSFQAAESGLRLAFNDGSAFSLANLLNDQGTFDESDDAYGYEVLNLDKTDLGSEYDVNVEYRAWFREQKNSIARNRRGWDVGKLYFFFDLESTGSTRNSSATVSGGAYQVGPD